jgi:hypothetical protein
LQTKHDKKKKKHRNLQEFDRQLEHVGKDDQGMGLEYG